MKTATQHTPGPWLFDIDSERISSRNPPVLICEVFHSSEDSIDGDPESHANARLIAAAPELLEALRDMMANAVGNPKSCGHEWFCNCSWEVARAAIHKAEGE